MSETKYGLINGVPIDPGEGWEIVPWNDIMEVGKTEFSEDGVLWNPSTFSWGSWTPAAFILRNPSILAFRRPTALKEAGAGSLETDEDRKWRLARTELTQLRTLAKEQGEALEKAETMLRAFRYSMDKAVPFPSLEKLNEVITLIAKLKAKVGE